MIRISFPALAALALAFLTLSLNAEDAAALLMADDARIEALKSADKTALEAALSDELHYAHSNGVVETKAEFIAALTSGKLKYEGIDYEARNFTFPAPGVAMMTGRARVQAVSAKGPMDAVLAYLAVWRKEDGQWKFLAWQSCKLPPATN